MQSQKLVIASNLVMNMKSTMSDVRERELEMSSHPGCQ
jgi:hypothetical protein